ncbi:MAG: hypothetical protein ACLUQJ_05400 [Alphaproteobacteria bacterium]
MVNTYLRSAGQTAVKYFILLTGYCCMFTFAAVMISVSLLRGLYKTVEEKCRHE